MQKITSLLTLFFLGISVHIAYARFALPTLAPVDRLVTNTKAYMDEHPEDAHGYYILGRTHYLAFVNRATLIPIELGGDTSPPALAEGWPGYNYLARNYRAQQLALQELGYTDPSEIPDDEDGRYRTIRNRKSKELTDRNWQPEEVSASDAIAHATSAARNLRQAIRMDPKNGLYLLGLASLMDQFADFIKDATGTKAPGEFAQISPGTIRDTYYQAYKLAIQEDLKREAQPLRGLESLVGYEAGQAYVRWCAKSEDLGDGSQKRLAEVKRNLKGLEGLPIREVTPIIFSLEKATGLAGLLAPGSRVEFDLDGDGALGTWPWVKPTTGFLVWDPGETGRITSGRQMFGSVSWWLFFSNGYHALDALDNNRDGRLEGEELTGISVWFDGNTNGRSEPGEVSPLRTLGITALSTKATGRDRGSPMNPAGVILEDGRELPTYDWITSPFDAPALQ